MNADQTLDPNVYREVIGHFLSGVTVITTAQDGVEHGMSASAVSSLSLDPPMLLVCVNDASPTGQAISRSGVFCVNVLAESQRTLAMQFARPADDKFAGVAHHAGLLGTPVLDDALASIECRVENDVRAGTHHVFLGRVVDAVARDAAPLAYFRGGFGRVELTVNEAAHEQIRALVMERLLPVGEPLDVAAVAERVDIPRAQALQALLALQGEQLVEYDAEQGFVIVPIDRRRSAQTFDARRAIEIAALEMSYGQLSAAQIDELELRAQAANARLHAKAKEDRRGYVAANNGFHETLVGLAGNDALLDSYRRLRVPTIMAGPFAVYERDDDHIEDEHTAIVAAVRRGDLPAAKVAVLAHSEHTKQLNDGTLAANGGWI